MQKKRIISVAVSLLVICFAFSGCSLFRAPGNIISPDTPAFPSGSDEGDGSESAVGYRILNVGDTAPDFSVETLDGGKFFMSESREKVVVIYFWATWCAPCLNEMPGIQEIYDNSSRDELEIIAVNSGEKLGRVEQFLEQNSYSFLFAADEDFEIGDKYPNSGVPYVVIVGRDGTITDIFYGSKDSDSENFRAAVDAALGK